MNHAAALAAYAEKYGVTLEQANEVLVDVVSNRSSSVLDLDPQDLMVNGKLTRIWVRQIKHEEFKE